MPFTINDPPPKPRWKRVVALVTLIPIGTLLTIWGTVFSYKTIGADELRTLVYQPLYADLVQVENSLKAVDIEGLPSDKALKELRRTGAIKRIPSTLQKRLDKVFTEATGTHMAALPIHDIVIREMSSRIMEIRTEEADRAWHQKTSAVLREMSMAKSKKGISDLFTLAEGVTHESVGQVMDVRDPTKPVIAGPGGPIFVIRDWLGYPESIKIIEDLWKKNDYLYFNVRHTESWYYRLTREDLNRIDTTLEQFVKPVYDVLKENSNFKILLTDRLSLLSEISDMKFALTDRIRDPKHLSDLWD
jgi:hypothetical protein